MTDREFQVSRVTDNSAFHSALARVERAVVAHQGAVLKMKKIDRAHDIAHAEFEDLTQALVEAADRMWATKARLEKARARVEQLYRARATPNESHDQAGGIVTVVSKPKPE